jgi:hypothetical protein
MMIKKMLLVGILLSSTQTLAAVKCPQAKVNMVRPSGDTLMIQLEGQNWHVLAEASDNDYQKKLGRALKAQRNNQLVELSFPNGYDESCLITDSTVKVKKLKLIKNKTTKGND